MYNDPFKDFPSSIMYPRYSIGYYNSATGALSPTPSVGGNPLETSVLIDYNNYTNETFISKDNGYSWEKVDISISR